ncbi:helix-turn-helix domain-containing protein [Cereibacter sp. SYSU M97828]|nr:helix-turn-helix domain-containing protein [Cereibacter flavus]
MLDLDLHDEIKARLRKAGSGISAIARELGITPGSVTVVSQGYRRSQKVQRAIADKLGTTPEVIWPARYEKEADMDT